MQPVDIKKLELLENRMTELEKMISTCSKQIQENNVMLEQILSSVNSAKQIATSKL